MKILLTLLLALYASLSSQAVEEILITADPSEAEEVPGTQTHTISIDPINSGHKTLGDVLKQSAGVYVQKSYGSEGNSISLRGFSKGQIKILIDGFPIEEGRGWVYLDQIPLSIIEKVSISRGPMSSLYGNSAMGGVIKITTKKSVDRKKLYLSYGSFESTQIAFDTLIEQNQNNHYSLSTNIENSKGNYNILETRKKLENNHKKNVDLSLAHSYKNTYTSLFTNFLEKELPGNQDQPTFYTFLIRKSYNMQIRNENNLTENISTEWALQHTLNSEDYHDPKGEYNGFPKDTKSLSRSYGGELRVKSLYFDSFFPNLYLQILGEDYDSSHVDAYRATYMLSFSFETYLYNDRIIITPSYSFNHATALPMQKDYGISTLFKVSDKISIHSQIGTSFRYPNFEELYRQQGYVVGNPNLQPEKSYGGDFGLEWSSNLLFLSLSYFHFQTENLINYESISALHYKPFNVDSSESKGLELEGKLHFDTFEWNTEVTWQNIRNNDPESLDFQKFIPSKPWIYGHSRIQQKFLKTYMLSLDYFFAKSRFINSSNTKKLKDHESMDLGFGINFQEKYITRFDIRNFRNQNNVDTRGFPLPGRSYFLSFEKTFL